MTELPRWCPACHGSFNLADELNGNVALCAYCEAVTHGGHCAQQHGRHCWQARLAEWTEGVRRW